MFHSIALGCWRCIDDTVLSGSRKPCRHIHTLERNVTNKLLYSALNHSTSSPSKNINMETNCLLLIWQCSDSL